MILTRRLILRLFARAGVVLGLGSATTAMAQDGAGAKTALAPAVRATLDGFVDTLIPRDEASPGALATGIAEQFETAAAAVPKIGQLITAGCDWLDAEAGKAGADSFAALGEEGRAAIVGRAAAADPVSLPRQFFERTRRAALAAYYANPASWPSLGFDGPPQPFGFPDYAESPARRG